MEFIYFGSQQLLQKCNTENIIVINKTITRCDKVRYLGGIHDSSLQFKAHITKKCKVAMVNLIWIKDIMKYINNKTCHTLVRSLALSHLDYCNSILEGLPNVNKCNAMYTKHWSKNHPKQNIKEIALQSASGNYIDCQCNKEWTLKYSYSYSNHSTNKPQSIYRNLSSRSNKEEKA